MPIPDSPPPEFTTDVDGFIADGSKSSAFRGVISSVRVYLGGRAFGGGDVRSIYDEELAAFNKTAGYKPIAAYSKSLNLAMPDAYAKTGSVDLFAGGIDDYSKSLDLSMTGAYLLDGGVDFSTQGVAVQAGSLNLSLESYPPPAEIGSVPLSMIGSTGSGVFASADLSMTGGVFAGLNLFLAGDDSPQPASAPMNLYLESRADYVGHSVDMVVANNTVAVGSGLNLKISGAGTWANSVPGSGSVSMYIERNTAGMVPMVIGAPWGSAGSGVHLSMTGAGPIASGVLLSIPQVTGLTSKSVNMYTHGF